jgi:hypothetical protein
MTLICITFLLVTKYFVLNLYKGTLVHYDYFSLHYNLTSQ